MRVRLDVYEKLLEDPDLLLKQRYPHNTELLREIRRQGYPTALATMSHRYQVEHILSVPGTGRDRNNIWDAGDVMAVLRDLKVDMVLSGHKHVPYVWSISG